ncbi:MAG: acyl-CoA dehydrogenase family protein [Pseudomonadota bacterium]|uniref:Acyl-CoA dehydrogenase n=1 Tax=marine metagenome TaxID=408172 RepID=A0A381W7J3_9ZZZZ|nr:acyl-CoA dehydrogenase family protein [Pseudomonadota bacterium]MEE3183414.1 acyl-CoA dehydrogenase family protein [Pseudomonadota bacterium]HCP48700.1 acyl-CoA dehydrogenase [Gammaproteobacteria bacterium]|tara:strand:+ start:361 stop:1545 length:1185 start_codon:yes stop_codon:yes gene_type:complete
MADIDDFRAETRSWLEDNCPAGARGPGPISTGATSIAIDHEDTQLWLDRMIEKGWTAPVWPKEYGGGGLDTGQYMALIQEMRRIDARAPLGGMGVSLIGPTLLEYGTDEQKARHIPRIVRGEVAWCQGYSEPGSGSDLASLSTRAQDKGDHFVVNGQKIWTSGAQYADWIFALVRTDPDVPKHEGISFVLMDMHQDGITVSPIRLISGESPFCETFFDNAIARKDDLVGELNKGWTVGKRLLQHERGSMASLVGGGAVKDTGPVLEDEAKAFGGEANGRIADAVLRDRILLHNMNSHVFHLTQRRTVEEASDGNTPGPATSIFKMYGTELQQERSSLFVEIRGTQGLGWTGDEFTGRSLMDTRAWLSNRAASIYSGSNEIQRNIIAKRVLGLPD